MDRWCAIKTSVSHNIDKGNNAMEVDMTLENMQEAFNSAIQTEKDHNIVTRVKSPHFSKKYHHPQKILVAGTELFLF